MGIGNIFKAFQPKDTVFFTLFEKVAINLVEMSEYFHNGIQNFDANDESFLKKIHDFEHQNDDLTHQIYMELGKNFITPFDREDIQSLATSLDDVADYIYASTRYIFLFKSPETKAYEEFSLLIHKACIEIQNAIINQATKKSKKRADIGDIEVLEKFSFFEVEKSFEKDILNNIAAMKFKGKEMRAEVAN